MSTDIFEKINSTLSEIDKLRIPKKFVRDKLTAVEFNKVVDKINELQNYLNTNTKEVIVDTTSYILDKIRTAEGLVFDASSIKMSEDNPTTIFDKINEIQNILDTNTETLNDHNTSLIDIQRNISGIAAVIGTIRSGVTDEINAAKDEAIETSKDYTDQEVSKAYTDAKNYTDEQNNTYLDLAKEYAKDYTDTSYDMLFSYINENGNSNVAYEMAKEYVDQEVSKVYNDAKEYTDQEVGKTYNSLYTMINDTTLTFEYNVSTDPGNQPKRIYDSNDNIYDGSYHD